ncbi:LPXTG cell wall anchor domain-containing protein [Enterococcus sp. ALS3]|uniref:LPXTG cell wall anchor domain-containing protein n=1 Tax=Enterococcus alishanensis TaxID=1303817 RepID=A0ABS6TD04_9ENTE|nr:LPXTG cell wall anchor domain-containing protein [Enterococcus alishanensis]MBV7390775.1 LPXTG cell wall anchor domain-containing protein [Enterococcus alishanensis]
MKKIFLVCVLSLAFPVAAMADTTESVTNSSIQQEQKGYGAIVTDKDEINSETSSSNSLEKEKIATTDSTATDAVKETTETVKEQVEETTQSSQSEKSESSTTSSEESAKKDDVKDVEDYTPAYIRELLTDSAYPIDAKELAGYSDEQLANAMKLFERYNQDVTGMDMGGYVRVLRMVYKDHVISWEAAEKALTFNPNQYQTIDELLANVDQLYDYVQVLYPENTFFSLKNLSKTEWIHILNYLADSGIDMKQFGGGSSVFSGVAWWIQDSSEGNAPYDNGPKKTEEVKNLATTAKPATTQTELPKTGTRNNVFLTVAGVFILGLAVFGIRKVRH